jgi:hypothetical protein
MQKRQTALTQRYGAGLRLLIEGYRFEDTPQTRIEPSSGALVTSLHSMPFHQHSLMATGEQYLALCPEEQRSNWPGVPVPALTEWHPLRNPLVLLFRLRGKRLHVIYGDDPTSVTDSDLFLNAIDTERRNHGTAMLPVTRVTRRFTSPKVYLLLTCGCQEAPICAHVHAGQAMGHMEEDLPASILEIYAGHKT